MGINQDFINELASKAPTPGGGGASAYCGALATALSSMVGNLTVGKKAYAAVEQQVQQALAELEALRAHLIELIESDAQAFKPLSQAYALPKATPEEAALKARAIQKALVGATEVPLEIMKACAQVVAVSECLVYNGSRLALSDAGIAVLFAKAALEGASLNVYTNAALMADAAQAAAYTTQADEVINKYGALATTLYEYVVKEIR